MRAKSWYSRETKQKFYNTQLEMVVSEDLKHFVNEEDRKNKNLEKAVIETILKIKSYKQKIESQKDDDHKINVELQHSILRLKEFDHIVVNITV